MSRFPSLSREALLWVVCLTGAIIYCFIQVSGGPDPQAVREKVSRIQSKIIDYRMMRASGASPADNKTLSLSRLEQWTPSPYVSELTPMGKNDEGKPVFSVELEAAPGQDVFQLLRDLESNGSARILSFRVERISTTASEFDAQFRVQSR